MLILSSGRNSEIGLIKLFNEPLQYFTVYVNTLSFSFRHLWEIIHLPFKMQGEVHLSVTATVTLVHGSVWSLRNMKTIGWEEGLVHKVLLYRNDNLSPHPHNLQKNPNKQTWLLSPETGSLEAHTGAPPSVC